MNDGLSGNKRRLSLPLTGPLKRTRTEACCSSLLQSDDTLKYSSFRTNSLAALRAIRKQVVQTREALATQQTKPQNQVSDRPTNAPQNDQVVDEGLCVYTQNLAADSDCRNPAIVNLFNASQRHLRLSQFDAARKVLYVASVHLKMEQAPSSLAVCVYHNLGYCYYRLEQPVKALKCFMAALYTAEDDLQYAHSQNAVGVILFHRGQSSDSLVLLSKSLQTYRSDAQEQQLQLANCLNNIGRVYFLQKEYEQASSVYEESLAIRKLLLPHDSLDLAVSLCNVGQAHCQGGNTEKASECFEAFFSQATKLKHRCVATVARSLAEIRFRQSKPEDARALFLKALQVFDSLAEDADQEVAVTLNQLADVHCHFGELDEALSCYKRELKLEQTFLDPTSPQVFVTLLNIAQVYRKQGNFLEALEYYMKVHALTVQTQGADSIGAAAALGNVALMHYHLREYEKALDLYQLVLTVQRTHYGSEDNLVVATTLNSLGLVFFNIGILGAARNFFNSALAVRTKLLGPDDREVGVVWYNLATIYLNQGNEEVALKYYRETLRIEKAALGPDHPDVITTIQHIGTVHQQRGELVEALDYFETALKAERKRGEGGRLCVAKLLNLIGNIHLQAANIKEMMDCYAESSRIYLSLEYNIEELIIAGYNTYALSKSNPPAAALA